MTAKHIRKKNTFVDHPDAKLLMPRGDLVRDISFDLVGHVVQWTEMAQFVLLPAELWIGRGQLAHAVGHLLETEVGR